MRYKEIPCFECKELCMYKDGEECSLTLERFNEHEDNESLASIKCVEYEKSYERNLVEKQLMKEAEENGKSGEVAPVQSEIIQSYHTYTEYKEELDRELSKTAEGFVRIGYLLKVARDTDILHESGYATVTEFAQAEYDIDKTQVSRFIHINDRFSEGGYSDHLMQQYQGFGYAKLTLMLQLPDAVNESLSPGYSKAEIQAIKEEVDEENKISDLEVMLEQPGAAVEESLISRLVRQLGGDEPELFVEMHRIFAAPAWTIEDVKETMAPQGEKTYSVRIPGIGRIMLMLNTESEEIPAVNVRTGEKESYGWEDLPAAWLPIMDFAQDAEKNWSEVYCREFPKVAPVQPEKPEQKKKETKVKKAVKDPTDTKGQQVQLHDIDKTAPEVAQEEPEEETPPIAVEADECENHTENEEPEQQLPGQMSVEDMPEVMPEPEEEPTDAEPEAGELDREKQIRGYRAAVTNNLNTLRSFWEGTNENKIRLMLDTLKDLKWRLEQIQRIEDE